MGVTISKLRFSSKCPCSSDTSISSASKNAFFRTYELWILFQGEFLLFTTFSSWRGKQIVNYIFLKSTRFSSKGLWQCSLEWEPPFLPVHAGWRYGPSCSPLKISNAFFLLVYVFFLFAPNATGWGKISDFVWSKLEYPKKIQVKCICKGLHPQVFSERALQHYCLSMCLRWTGNSPLWFQHLARCKKFTTDWSCSVIPGFLHISLFPQICLQI